MVATSAGYSSSLSQRLRSKLPCVGGGTAAMERLMHKMQLVMWAALAITIALPIYLLRRTRDVFSGLNELVAERHFTTQC